jgi:hypothetical protein
MKPDRVWRINKSETETRLDVEIASPGQMDNSESVF